jgi:hypothetical protein
MPAVAAKESINDKSYIQWGLTKENTAAVAERVVRESDFLYINLAKNPAIHKTPALIADTDAPVKITNAKAPIEEMSIFFLFESIKPPQIKAITFINEVT